MEQLSYRTKLKEIGEFYSVHRSNLGLPTFHIVHFLPEVEQGGQETLASFDPRFAFLHSALPTTI